MPYYCGDCALILNSEAQKSQHYSGRRHNLRVNWLKRQLRDDDDRQDAAVTEVVVEGFEGLKQDMQMCWNDLLRGKCDTVNILERIALFGGGKRLALAIAESLKSCAGDSKEILNCVRSIFETESTDYSVEMGRLELKQMLYKTLTSQLGFITTCENEYEGEGYDAFEEQRRRLFFLEEVYVNFSISLVTTNLAPVALLYVQLQKILLGELVPRSLLLQRLGSMSDITLTDHAVYIATCLFSAIIYSDEQDLQCDYRELLIMLSASDKKLNKKLTELKKQVSSMLV